MAKLMIFLIYLVALLTIGKGGNDPYLKYEGCPDCKQHGEKVS